MREINIHKKTRIIRLYLRGLSYDEIVGQIGVSKGSVVNIVNDFREGKLRLPPDMSEYVDALRQVAVDLRKSSTTVNQLKSYLRIHSKLKQMGVQLNQTEEWLDICQGLAAPPVTSNAFTSTALELARLTSEGGMSYGEVVTAYKEKVDSLKSTGKRISQSRNEVAKLNTGIDQATAKLNSINKAVAEGEEALRGQKAKFKSQERLYLARRKLTEKKVKLIEAAINSGFKSSGLTDEEAEGLREQIIAIGSLARTIKHKEKQRDELKSQVDNLNALRQYYYNVVCDFQSRSQRLEVSIVQKERAGKELEAELLSTATEVNKRIEDLALSHIIIDFLVEPGKITNSDFDRLVEMMIMLRQKRLGIKPEYITDASGKMLCRCRIPAITTDLKNYKVDIDLIREKFAFSLEPLFRDKLVSKLRYEVSNMQHENQVRIAELKGIMKGLLRNQQHGLL